MISSMGCVIEWGIHTPGGTTGSPGMLASSRIRLASDFKKQSFHLEETPYIYEQVHVFVCVCSDDVPSCHTFSPMSSKTLVEETVSREIYEDTHSLLREMINEMTSKLDVGLSFKFSLTEVSMSIGAANPNPDPKPNLEPNANPSTNADPSIKLSAGFHKTEMIRQVSEYTKIKVNSYKLFTEQ